MVSYTYTRTQTLIDCGGQVPKRAQTVCDPGDPIVAFAYTEFARQAKVGRASLLESTCEDTHTHTRTDTHGHTFPLSPTLFSLIK